MLSFGKLVSARYYLDSVAKGIEDYYAGHGEAPGVWMGAGAAALGLSGQVEGDDLRAVLAGQEPGGEMLVSGKAALTRSGRRLNLRLDQNWQWAKTLAAGFDRLRAAFS
jgi:conjugative relaxase-like TrwC/TraI family protein